MKVFFQLIFAFLLFLAIAWGVEHIINWLFTPEFLKLVFGGPITYGQALWLTVLGSLLSK